MRNQVLLEKFIDSVIDDTIYDQANFSNKYGFFGKIYDDEENGIYSEEFLQFEKELTERKRRELQAS